MNTTLDKFMINKEFLDKVRYVLRGNELSNIAHCSQSPNLFYTNIWANGRKGSIVCDRKYGSTYRFYEEGKDTETKDAEIVCTGFIGFLISNSNFLLSIADTSDYDLRRDFYDSFIAQIIQNVKNEMRLKPGFWKLTNDDLYYQEVVAQDTYESLIDESIRIFDYLTQEEGDWIKAYVQDYIEYIWEIVLPEHGITKETISMVNAEDLITEGDVSSVESIKEYLRDTMSYLHAGCIVYSKYDLDKLLDNIREYALTWSTNFENAAIAMAVFVNHDMTPPNQFKKGFVRNIIGHYISLKEHKDKDEVNILTTRIGEKYRNLPTLDNDAKKVDKNKLKTNQRDYYNKIELAVLNCRIK